MKFLIIFTIICFFSQNLFAEVNRILKVKGVAEKTFQPDLVYISINLWSKGENAEKAQEQNAILQQKIISVASKEGIAKENLKTLNFELNPEYQYDTKNGVNKMIGHICNQSISIKYKSLLNLGKFLDKISENSKEESKGLKAGININSLTWDLSNRTEEEKKLLSDAIIDAKNTSEILAKAAGVKIKSISFISPEGSANTPIAFEAAPMMMKSMGDSAPKGTSVFSGELKLQANIAVEFLIE